MGKLFILENLHAAVWLFQEYERVSSDHLFRVRMVQPNSLESQYSKISKAKSDFKDLPTKCDTICVVDICVFHNSTCCTSG